MKDFFDVTGAILIMGLIFLLITKMEVAWRGRSILKNSNKGIEDDKQALLAIGTNIRFWRRKKALFICAVVVALLIVGVIYHNRTQNELACLEKIDYRGSTIYRIEGESDRKFKTQAEAMNYCLKVLN